MTQVQVKPRTININIPERGADVSFSSHYGFVRLNIKDNAIEAKVLENMSIPEFGTAFGIPFEFYASVSGLEPDRRFTKTQHEIGFYATDPYDVRPLSQMQSTFWRANSGLTPPENYSDGQHFDAWAATLTDTPPGWVAQLKADAVAERTTTNLATNPSFETTSGTAEVRRNLVPNPSFSSGIGQWLNGGANGATTANSGADTPNGSAGYLRLTRQNATAGNCYTRTNDISLAVGTYTLSAWVRIGAPGTQVQLLMGNVTGVAGGSPATSTVVGPWARVSSTYTVATAGTFWVGIRDDGTVTPVAGATYDLDDVLLELTSTVGSYFDGSTPPKVRRNLTLNPRGVSGGGWSSTAAAGPSVSPITDFPGDVTTAIRATLINANAGLMAFSFGAAVNAGSTVSGRVRVRTSGALTGVSMDYRPAGASSPTVSTVPVPDLAAGSVTDIPFTLLASTAASASTSVIGLRWSGGSGAGATVDMTAALIEVSPAPDTYFDGATGAPSGFATAWEGTANASPSYLYDSDLTPAWTGTANASASVLRGQSVANMGTTPSDRTMQSSRWAASGTKSLRIESRPMDGTSVQSFLQIGGYNTSTFTSGKTYTFMAKAHLEAPLSGTLAAQTRTIEAQQYVGGAYSQARSEVFPNIAGDYDVRLVYTFDVASTQNFIRLWNGASAGGGAVWWDNLLIVEGNYTGDYFDGRTPGAFWTGTPDASTSVI